MIPGIFELHVFVLMMANFVNSRNVLPAYDDIDVYDCMYFLLTLQITA